MKKLKLKLKLITRVSFLLIFCLVLCIESKAQSFDRSINSLSKQFTEKDYTKILSRLTSLTPSKELEDIYLYLKAESLKNLKQKNEAMDVYEEIIGKFPTSEVAKSCFFPLFLLKLENAYETNISSLEAMAIKLPTNWQAGNAFEKLHNLNFLKAGKKSRYALQSLKRYTSGTNFYRQAPATKDILKTIWKNATQYEFLDIEWLEILKITASENMLDEIFDKKGAVTEFVRQKVDPVALEIFRASWLCNLKKFNDSIKIYTGIINNSATMLEMRLNALQLRGDAYHFSEKHKEAVADYKRVLNVQNPTLDHLAAEYRMMRSLFRLKLDTECLASIKRLIKGKNAGWLLPSHIYEMGIECYDNKEFTRAIPYFMIFNEHYIGHHRADDALGYSYFASGGNKTAEGKAIFKKLKSNYTNSFFLWWADSSVEKEKIKYTDYKLNKLSNETQHKITRLKKLWGTIFESFAKAEANTLTNKYPRNFALFKTLIEVAETHDDYQQICSYGERLARQLLESGKSLNQMPLWGWQAMYPQAFEKEVRKNGDKFAVDPYWILSIMREESHFQIDIKSRSNAMSLMQILPTTGNWIATKLGIKNFKESMLWDQEINIMYGTWYLKYLHNMFEKDMFLASAAYNGGQGNITRKVQAIYPNLPILERIDKVPMTETRDYYKKVMGSYYTYKRIYQ